jgi:uncharacterized protein (DUF433 family)
MENIAEKFNEQPTKSPMLKMIESKNIGVKYPENTGKPWNAEEDEMLLNELNENMSIEQIANSHKRTLGGIRSRCEVITYNMHITGISTEEIMEKTQLSKEQIEKAIIYRNNKEPIQKNKTQIKKTNVQNELKNPPYETQNINELRNEINGIKTDIKEVKYMVGELMQMMKAVYEFEDA